MALARSFVSMLLTDKQRRDLNAAVLQYLEAQGVAPEALAAVRALPLGGSPPEDQLERKWTAVIRLQRRILDLEAILKARESEPVPSKDGLPASTPIHVFEGHRQPVTTVSFHPKWTSVASGSEDGTIKIWDAELGEFERTIRAHTRSVTSIQYGAGRGLLASCSSDLAVKIWDPKNDYTITRTFVGHEHTVSAVAFVPPDDMLLLSASRDKTVRVWQVDTGFCLRVIKGPTDWVRTLSPSPDGRVFLCAGNDRTVRAFELDTGTCVLTHAVHEHVIETVCVAPAAAYERLARLQGLAPPASRLGVHVQYFASAGRDKTIIITDIRQQRVCTLVGHDNWVRAVAFHPDGKYLYSVADDKTMRVWDLDSAKCVKIVEAHDHFVTSLALCSHGRARVATGSVDLKVKLW